VSSAVADRYARAVFELGIETGQLKPLTDQVRSFAEVYRSSPELRSVIDNPIVEESKRQAILEDICGKLALGELARNTVKLLAFRRRLQFLPDIARRLGTLSDEKAGILRATVTSAVPLSESNYQALAAEIERATKKKVVLERKHDPTLIAGVVTRIGDNTIDGTLKGQLAHLQRQLLAS
jgi:F-type H+-transporting ATPase subunit delta